MGFWESLFRRKAERGGAPERGRKAEEPAGTSGTTSDPWPEAFAYMEVMAERALGADRRDYLFAVADLLRFRPVSTENPRFKPAYAAILYHCVRSRAEGKRYPGFIEVDDDAFQVLDSFFDPQLVALARAFDLDLINLERLHAPGDVGDILRNPSALPVAKASTVKRLQAAGIVGLYPLARTWVSVGRKNVAARET